MYKTHNAIMDLAARELCRKLRGTQTKSEILFWRKIRNRKFHGLKFYRQIPIFYEFDDRESFFIADFFCFEKKLVIEIDGNVHNYKFKQDAERSNILNNLGLSVYRVRNEEIEINLSLVLKKLSLFLKNQNQNLE